MEKDYVKDTYKALAFLVSIMVLWFAEMAYCLFISHYEFSFFEANAAYILTGGAVGLLLGCLYGWLYLKQEKIVRLSITTSACLLTTFAYLGSGIFLIKSLVSYAYVAGLLYLVIILVATSAEFRCSIKEARDYENLIKKINQEFAKQKEEFEQRKEEIIKGALIDVITKRVIKRIKQNQQTESSL